MKLNNYLLAGLLVVGIVIFINWETGRALLQQNEVKKDQERQNKSLTVKVITQAVAITTNDRVFDAIGTGKARLSVNIFPSVTGEVTKVNFIAQDRVEQGDVLLELDSREEKLAVRLAEVKLSGAKNLLARYEQAVKDGAVPESEVDSARTEMDAAQVALEQAVVALDNRQIKAPFAGVVGIPNVDVGDRVDPGTLITGLDDRNILYVDFEIPESMSGLVQSRNDDGPVVTAATPAFPGKEFNAMISARESRLDPQKRTLMVRANIENTEDILRPGMSFRLTWIIAGKPYPTVPEITLQWGRDGSFVWIIRDGIAEKVPVRVVARSSGRVLLEGAIQAGEPVVVEGLQRLGPGARVEMLTAKNEQ